MIVLWLLASGVVGLGAYAVTTIGNTSHETLEEGSQYTREAKERAKQTVNRASR